MLEIYSEENRQDDTYVNAGLCLYIILACYRAITQMRSIDSVRYLIAMIQRVFYDMLPFFTVLALAIISLSVVEIQLSKTRDSDDEKRFQATGTFVWSKMNDVYQIGYGNWEDTELRVFFYLLFITESLLLPLVMFNLLIAIISKTYEEFEEDQELKDLTELFEILNDIAAVVQFLYKISRKFETEGYIHIIDAD